MTEPVRGRVFLAGPFKHLMDPATGLLAPAMKQRLEAIIQLLEAKQLAVHCAHRREAWGAEMMTPAECTKIDYDEIARADLLLAFPGVPASPGTHIELGWASAMQKQVVLLLERDQPYAFLVRGLHRVTRVAEITFSSDDDLMPQLEAWFSRYVAELAEPAALGRVRA